MREDRKGFPEDVVNSLRVMVVLERGFGKAVGKQMCRRSQRGSDTGTKDKIKQTFL